MSIIQTLGQKPWVDKDLGEIVDRNDPEYRAKKFALTMFLAMVSVLFSLFIVTLLARSQYPDFEALASTVWQPFYDASRLWYNTVWLALSSVTIQLGLFSLSKNRRSLALLGVTAALVFAVQFVISQLALWRYLYELGFFVQSNPANSYFYLFTAIHAVHLLGGIIVLALALANYWRSKREDKFTRSVRLCSRYWHYLLAVWLILFALLTSSPETYKTLAALCGY